MHTTIVSSLVMGMSVTPLVFRLDNVVRWSIDSSEATGGTLARPSTKGHADVHFRGRSVPSMTRRPTWGARAPHVGAEWGLGGP
jgi:hypothetical protein